MRVHETKTKEMAMHPDSSIDLDYLPRISIKGKQIERVDAFKLFGVIISSDLSWSAHVSYILKKVSKRMYCIRYLVRAGVNESDIVQVYTSIVRSVLEYACPVWQDLPWNSQ